MRRIAAILALLLWPALAMAQIPGNLPAKNVFGNPAATSGPPTAFPIFSTADTWSALQTFTAGIASNPTAASLTQALNIASQPAGTTSSTQNCGGTVFSTWSALNCITATNWNVNAGTNQLMNVAINTEINGSSAQAGGTMFGLLSNVEYLNDAKVADRNSYSAFAGIVNIQASPGGNDFGIFGINCNVGSASITWPSNSQMICFEADNTTASSGLAGRAMMKFVNHDAGSSNLQGSSFDALIYAVTSVASSSFGFKNFVLLDGTNGKIIGTNGCIICTAGTPTITTGIDWSGWTFSGNQVKGPGFLVDGSGNTQIGFNSGSAVAPLTVRVATNANLVVINNSGLALEALNNASNAVVPLSIQASLTSFAQGGVALPSPSVQSGSTYSVAVPDSVVVNNGAGTLTLTLPAVATFPGRLLMVRTYVNQTVVSATSNVAVNGAAAGTAILAATAGKWALLQSDGTSWNVILNN